MTDRTPGEIAIVTAGAGSGKTTKVAAVIAQAIAEGTEPQRIIATTFTRRAAAELVARICGNLVGEGRLDDARRVQGALIGTVNSVCAALLGRFSYDLGISSEIRVLDEREGRALITGALGISLDTEVVRELDAIGHRLGQNEPSRPGTDPWTWRNDVELIVSFARSNGIASRCLDDSKKESIRDLSAALPAVTTGRPEVIDWILAEIPQALAGMSAEDKTQATENAKSVMRRAESQLRNGGDHLPWKHLANLASLATGAKSREAVEKLTATAARYEQCREYHEDLTRYVELCFSAAAQVMTAFQRRKRERGVMDFVDQEALLLEAMETSEVAREISASFDLLVVDEFQDTSPIQLALFLKLMSFGLRLIWVGDPKQSIYGFRDADPALMIAAMRSFPESLGESLNTSYRSRPGIVHFTNAVFTRAFSVSLPGVAVALAPDRSDPAGAAPAVELWRYPFDPERKRIACFYEDLASGVQHILESGRYQVTAGGIAVLCRSNSHCTEVAVALSERGLSVVMERPDLLGTPEAVLLIAALRYLADKGDTLAIAEILLLTGNHSDAAPVVASRLASRLVSEPASQADLWAAGNTVIEQVDAIRAQVSTLSVAAVLDAVIVRCEIQQAISRFGEGARVAANLDRLNALIGEYADVCIVNGLDATVAGAVLNLDELAASGGDSQAIPGSEDAIHVLTYHGAKGLEWPLVIATDLDSTSREKIFATEMRQSSEEISIEAPLADRSIRFLPDPGTGAGGELSENLRNSPAFRTRTVRERAEADRLLYVGLTRARDYLILPVRLKAKGEPQWNWLESAYAAAGDDLALPESDGVYTNLFTGTADPVSVWVVEAPRSGSPGQSLHDHVEILAPQRGRKDFDPYIITPSGEAGPAMPPTVTTISYGTELSIRGTPEADALGEACHVVFGLAAGRSKAPTPEEVARILVNYGVSGALEPAALCAQASAFVNWMTGPWPGASVEMEPSARMMRGNQLVSARLDLVIHTKSEIIIIDHKTIRGTVDPAETMARYAGQLEWYRAIVTEWDSEGRDVGVMLNLVVQGVVVSG